MIDPPPALPAPALPAPAVRTLTDIQHIRRELAANVVPLATLAAGRRVHVRDEPQVTVISAVDRVGPSPCVIFFHGGGLIFGDRHFEGAALIDLAEEHQLVVLAVDYRLAPEHPYPAALDDCLASLDWAVAHADELGIDPAAIIVAGRSAGGHLAAATALRARDEGRHRLAGQLLIYPMLDDRTGPGAVPGGGELPFWNGHDNAAAWQAYLAGAGDAAYSVPARASSFAGLPPTYVEVGSVDLFAPESMAFAAAILRAGGPVELHVWEGAFHGFDHLDPAAPVARAALAARSTWLARLLGA